MHIWIKWIHTHTPEMLLGHEISISETRTKLSGQGSLAKPFWHRTSRTWSFWPDLIIRFGCFEVPILWKSHVLNPIFLPNFAGLLISAWLSASNWENSGWWLPGLQRISLACHHSKSTWDNKNIEARTCWFPTNKRCKRINVEPKNACLEKRIHWVPYFRFSFSWDAPSITSQVEILTKTCPWCNRTLLSTAHHWNTCLPSELSTTIGYHWFVVVLPFCDSSPKNQPRMIR